MIAWLNVTSFEASSCLADTAINVMSDRAHYCSLGTCLKPCVLLPSHHLSLAAYTSNKASRLKPSASLQCLFTCLWHYFTGLPCSHLQTFENNCRVAWTRHCIYHNLQKHLYELPVRKSWAKATRAYCKTNACADSCYHSCTNLAFLVTSLQLVMCISIRVLCKTTPR